MTINDLTIGSKLIFGRFRQRTPFQQDLPRTLQWIKLSRHNDFVSEYSIGFLMFDPSEPNARSREHRNGGNNFYPVSVIDQYLNARDVQDWFSPRHEFDCCSPGLYPDHGFLSLFTDDEYNMLIPRAISIQTPQGSIRQYGEVYTTERRVALPSVAELTAIPSMRGRYPVEGSPFPAISSSVTRCLTRTASGPGSVCEYNFIQNCVTAHAANRNASIRPIIRLTDADVEECTPGYWTLCPPNPYEHDDKTEFLSLLNAF